VNDQAPPDALFDYDARPVTPQIVLVGKSVSPAAYAIRDFLSRNGCFYDWIDFDQAGSAPTAFGVGDIDASLLPLCILPDGTRLAPATIERVAAGLGMVRAPAHSEYDLTIVGAGPAGLAAAVYAASEGLRVVVIEAVAPGGQAGTTSMIENYLGFPNGISGSELATRATSQARRFGAEILLARSLVEVRPDSIGYVARLSDGTEVRGHSLLFAAGVDWRRLDVPGIDELLGAGVYYGAGPSEVAACTGARVVVVGGGNSAGQAVVRFSLYARQVTLLVRGSDLRKSMSEYLVQRVSSLSNVDIRTGSAVVGVEGDGRLRQVIVGSDGGRGERLVANALFVCIGGTPRTAGVSEIGLVTDEAGYIVTGSDLGSGPLPRGSWTLPRPPFPLETNLPRLFAAGDVRRGSIKRCAAAIGEGAMAVALVHRRLAEVAGE
jgi:thioredoxin reductase (NADPH)